MPIPQKPLAVSKAKKKLPVSLDWGEGIPKDHLRYINADEEALIKRFRTSKVARDYAGIPAYADDSASSKGVSRSGTTTGTTTTKSSTGSGSPSGGSMGQGGQSRGPSGAGQGPNSPSSSASGSKSPSSTSSPSGGGYKGQSAASVGPSRAPNAAAQAASNAYRSPQTNASVSPGTGKAPSAAGAPNMAASYASQKLNATSNALKAGQQPQSIQGMINSQSGTSSLWGGQIKAPTQSAAGAEKLTQDKWFNGQLGSLYNDPAINRNLPNALKEGMWNQRISDATKLAQDPAYVGSFGERSLAPWDDSGFRTKAQAAANAAAGTGIRKSFHNYGLAADIVTPGMPSYLSKGYKTWENDFALANQDLAGHIPDSYGIKWGGDFGDPAHFQVGSGSRANAIDTYGSSVTREGVRPDGVVGPTASYGTGNVSVASSTPQASPLQEALDSWNPPKYTAIPAPSGQTVASAVPQMHNYPQTPHFGQPIPSSGVVSSPLGPIQRDPAAARMAGVQPPTAPARSPTMALSNPFGSYNPVAAGRMASLQTRLGVDDALSARPVQTASNAAPAGPSTYNPVSAPEDSPVYSDNPVQGSQNPMQDEGENPQVKSDRQKKYASRGATLGGIIAGHIGTIVGGTLGWQMGKTSPQQRQAIASNPQALQANVQSINDMVEQRGGKNNPNLKVTEVGLKDVLENPQKVTANPQAYTSLEQSLAALSQGIDPETGRVI